MERTDFPCNLMVFNFYPFAATRHDDDDTRRAFNPRPLSRLARALDEISIYYYFSASNDAATAPPSAGYMYSWMYFEERTV